MIYLNHNQTTYAVSKIPKNHFGLKGIKIKIFAHIAPWPETLTSREYRWSFAKPHVFTNLFLLKTSINH